MLSACRFGELKSGTMRWLDGWEMAREVLVNDGGDTTSFLVRAIAQLHTHTCAHPAYLT